jgi:hypothetical protein
MFSLKAPNTVPSKLWHFHSYFPKLRELNYRVGFESIETILQELHLAMSLLSGGNETQEI